jgi:hypothetical protein
VHDAHLKAKARKLRVEKKLTIDELSERLALPRTTIFYWVRDLPIRRPRSNVGQALGNRRMQQNYRELREAAYEQGSQEFEALIADPTFRDFVCMYIGEGYKRSRNTVSLANSDPSVIKLATYWIRRFARNKVTYALQYHVDQDPDELYEFWGRVLDIEPGVIRFQRKSNSGGLARRNWRSRHGVMTVCANDTLFRARLQAWIDRVQGQWLDFTHSGA